MEEDMEEGMEENMEDAMQENVNSFLYNKDHSMLTEVMEYILKSFELDGISLHGSNVTESTLITGGFDSICRKMTLNYQLIVYLF